MGKPVLWDYQLTLRPGLGSCIVTLHRQQRDTNTRFLWLQTDVRGGLESAEVDRVLQELYTAVVALMEITV